MEPCYRWKREDFTSVSAHLLRRGHEVLREYGSPNGLYAAVRLESALSNGQSMVILFVAPPGMPIGSTPNLDITVHWENSIPIISVHEQLSLNGSVLVLKRSL